ncbi:hypothetical protein QR680_009998 [Steinernema hermaphroditum]|uniref:7TM GPCR serpentine receptor class x (Srx) domain-containing protein n=1 Tax=Steinernema hermaphroditum TaxID=289476 RepID=A0AA39MAF1_9BILA|nr:hypothetical protein QR680_009998 [Steinernema hermaphroditum]
MNSSAPSHTWDNVFVGTVYLLANIIMLPIYVIFLIIFVRKEPYRSSMTFKIMFYLGVVECFQLVSGVQSGIMSFLDTTVHYDFDMIGGALNCVGLFGRPLFLLILALNRFVNLTRLIRSRKNEKIVFSVLLAIASLATFFGFAYRITIGKAHYYLGYDIYRPLKTTGAAAIIKHITRKTTRMLALLKSTDIPVIAQGIITLSHAAVVKCGTGHIFVSMLESRPANIAYIIWLETMTLINPLSYLILVRYKDAGVSWLYYNTQEFAKKLHQVHQTAHKFDFDEQGGTNEQKLLLWDEFKSCDCFTKGTKETCLWS